MHDSMLYRNAGSLNKLKKIVGKVPKIVWSFLPIESEIDSDS